jgi:hypothetical protein
MSLKSYINESIRSHLSRGYAASNQYNLPDQVDSRDEKDLINCAIELTPCQSDNDCRAACIPRSTGTYSCIGNNCMNEGIVIPNCMIDNGGVLVHEFDRVLNTFIYSCICQFPNIWNGPGCNEPVQTFCNGGRIVREPDGLWTCDCGSNILAKLNQHIYDLGSYSPRHLCIGQTVYDRLMEIIPGFITRIV